MRFRQQRPLHDGGFSVFDTFLDQVALTIGTYPVETGGAILGDYTSGVVTRFVFDGAAETTAASYTPSRRLSGVVNELERQSGLQFKGIVHSHPGNFDSPSGPDADAFLQGLDENPELSRFLAPIVTFREGDERDNKIPLPGGGWITFYVALRDDRRGVRIERTMPDIIHFGRDCRAIATILGRPKPVFSDGHNGTVPTVTAVLSLTDDLEMILTADGSYPVNPPTVILHRASRDQTSQLNLRWSAVVSPDFRLLHSISQRGIAAEGIPVALAFGSDGVVLTSNEMRAANLALDPILVTEAYKQHVADVETGLFARSKGLLSEALRTQTVLLYGAGSVGSYVAEQLVRSGVGGMTIIDPDTVEYSNLSRTAYTASDVGRLKVDALARRLLAISPSVKVNTLPMNLHDVNRVTFERLQQTSDIVICAVDDRRAQLLINHWAYSYGKPAVYIGIYAGARSGEVFYSETPLPCFKCATPFRDIVPEGDQRQTDYGTGALVAEVALGIDIQAITTAGIRLVLSRLVRGQESSLGTFAGGLGERQWMVMAIEPKNDLVDSVMDSKAGQYGYRSIWLNIERDGGCNVCGANPDPPYVTAQVSTDAIKSALEAETLRKSASQEHLSGSPDQSSEETPGEDQSSD